MTKILEAILNFIDLIGNAYPLLAPAVFVLVVIFDREKLSIKLDAVAKFLALLVIVGFVKICLWNGKQVFSNPYGLEMSNFLLVFLEDVFYVMVPFYLTNKIGDKKSNFLIWLAFSVMFGMGHRYQGVFAVFVTATYPYFVSNHFARKTSFGTVMACHFLWDCFVMVLPKINNLLTLGV